jgi:hypothetical protein
MVAARQNFGKQKGPVAALGKERGHYLPMLSEQASSGSTT